MEMSAEEIRQLDEMMRIQVNDMLQDILAERRRTTGLWDEEVDGKECTKLDVAEETDSEDSFEEKYVRCSGESAIEEEVEARMYEDSGTEEEEERKEEVGKEETKEEIGKEERKEEVKMEETKEEVKMEETKKIENVEKMEEIMEKENVKETVEMKDKENIEKETNVSTEPSPEKHSPFQHADTNLIELMLQQPFDDFFNEEEEASMPIEMELQPTENEEPLLSTETKIQETANTEEPSKPVEVENKNDNKSSTGFWCSRWKEL